MTEANEFKAVYRSAKRHDELLLPHYFEGVDDADLVGRLVDEHYGRSERRRTLHVLELGCGTGRVTSRLAPYAERLMAVDNSPSMIETFQARYPSAESLCLDIKEAVTRMLDRGQAGRFDVIGAFWSLSYCLGECFEEMTAEGIRPVSDPAVAREQAGRLVRELLRLLAPDGHLLVLLFDSETREQRLVTRLWERIAPFPCGGRGYTRQLLLDELRAAEDRGEGWLTHARKGGVAVAPTRRAARAWFRQVHLKGFPPLLDDIESQREIDEFVSECTQPSGEVIIPSGVHVIDFHSIGNPTRHHHPGK